MQTIDLKPGCTAQTILGAFSKTNVIIRFLPGVHKIKQTILLRSGQHIILEDGAKVYRCCQSSLFQPFLDSSKSYNYNALQEVIVDGHGVLYGDGVKKTGSIFSLIHSADILVQDISIRNVYKSHGFDLSGCNNVTIRNVSFAGRVINKEKPHKEEIQYDFAYYSGFPYYAKNSKIYNDNHCKNIFIIGCAFQDANTCIGTHTETNSAKKHSNIQVKNCNAKGIGLIGGEGTFLTLANIEGAIIQGNIIDGFGRAIEINSMKCFYRADGQKATTASPEKNGCNNIVIEKNTMKRANTTFKAPGIFIARKNSFVVHGKISITRNSIDLLNPNAVYDILVSDDVTDKVTLSNNKTKLKVKI